MRRLIACFFTIFLAFVGVGIAPAHAACTSDQIDVLGDGTQCETAKFSLTTTSLSANDTFQFSLSATGTFYVDCGADGVLSGTGASGKIITRSDTTPAAYTCTYTSAGAKTIKFGGTATGYNTNRWASAISFGQYYTSNSSYTNLTPAKIASVSGNLSDMFPWLSGNTADGAAPRFRHTFYNATNLDEIPGTLFANYTTGASSMFQYTFRGCSGLTSIPENLFFPNATSVTGANYMFDGTFYGCSGLTSIPANLFSKVTTSAQYMFEATFYGCSGLTSIPENLFFPNATSVTGADYMFSYTFYHCSGLTSLPANLFSKITTSASFMFYYTFQGCSGLTSLPQNLFFPNATSVTGANGMFSATFGNCSGLTSLPANLFSKITTGANYMFFQTFCNCSGLTSIPENLFFPNATSVTGADYMFSQTFYGCSGLTSLPANLFSKVTTSAQYMFDSTFYGCSGLTSLPANLFSKITSAAGYMFRYTFQDCTSLASYIPPTTFKGLTDAGAPTATQMFSSTFINTQLATSCPCGTKQFFTGYEGSSTTTTQLGGRVSCEPADNEYTITYEMNGGSIESGQTLGAGKYPTSYYDDTCSTTIDGVPTKSGYTFAGWCTDSTLETCAMSQTIGADATGAKTFYANWSECQACDATNATCSLSVVNNVCTYTTTCNTNYGNIQNNGAYNASCSPNSYAITYTMAGGTNYSGAPETYTYGTGVTINGVPAKTGYIFAGWCTDEQLQNCSMTQTIGTDATGDKTFYAKWSQCTACSATNATCSLTVENNVCTYTTTCNTGYGNIQNNGAYNASCSALVSYTVTYACGDGTGTAPASDSVVAETSFTPAASTGCTNGNKIFAGWAVSGTNDVVGGTFTYNYNSDKTLTAQWVEPGFTITTTNLSNNAEFRFYITASGTFVVDCGENGTLSGGTGVSGNTITRQNVGAGTVNEIYTCTYTTGGVKNIRFGGRATGYSVNAHQNSAAISFYKTSSNDLPTFSGSSIKSISGSMGSVFPTLNNGASTGDIPIFYSTFQQCSNLETISANLFDGVTGSRDSMFRSTFDKCTKLEEIPYGLFSGASGGAPNMFRSTFYECTSLPGIPKDLFAGVTNAADSLFKYTFYNCSGMSDSFIPPSTFSGLIENNSPHTTDMWSSTFGGTNALLTTCPAGTVAYHTGYDKYSATDYWNNKVSCECDGGHYLSGDTCAACPTGYTTGAMTGKTSESQCQIHCDAGTYLANANDTTCSDVGVGYWAAASDVNYGDTGTRTPCESGWTTANANGTSAAACSVPTIQCEGATYFDSGVEQCVPCPTGYTADTTSGKMSINQCKIHCDAGTYIANANDTTCADVGVGYYAPAADIAYGDSETHNACPENSTTTNGNSTSIEACMCTGARYMDNGVCVACPTGYTANTTNGKTLENQCQIHCDAGTYLANANDTECSDVGQGYWAAASDINYGSVGSRTQCASGTSTAGVNGTSAASCVDISLSCMGATYWDSTAGECVACPDGYNSNTTAGKTSINQCQKTCAAGKWMDTFTPVEYLQGNGSTTFIDTGYYVQSNNVSVNMVVGSDRNVGSSDNYGNFFGNMYKVSSSDKGGFSGSYKNNLFGFWSEKAGKKAQVNKSFELGKQYTYVGTMNASNISLEISDANGTTGPGSQTCTNITNTAQNTLKLFTNGSAFNNNGTMDTMVPTFNDVLFPGRMYSFEFYDGSDKVLDLIPVRRNSDNVLGMYNRVNGDFYPNAGTGTFTAGTVDTSATFGACMNVGDGYYNPANTTNYGSNGTRHQCPNNAVTNKENATSLRDCVGVTVYDCDLGEYMPANGNACATCTTGNYCAGGEFASTNVAQGLTACSTVGDGSYVNSVAGASSENACYKACSTSDVEHSSVVSGNDYYGNGVDTCAATACESGYELSSEVPGTCEEVSSYTVTYSCNGGDGTAPVNAIVIPNESFTPAANTCARTGYIFTGWGVSNTGTPGDIKAVGTAFTWEYGEDKTFAAQWSECAVCSATNATCSFDGVVNNVCTYTTACDTGYSNIQNNGAYNASCTANEITISWDDGDDDPTNNPTSTCTYDGPLITPSTAPIKRGYTFGGWLFVSQSTPSEQSSPEVQSGE